MLFALETYRLLGRKVMQQGCGTVDMVVGAAALLVLAYYGPLEPGHYYLYIGIVVWVVRHLVVRDDSYFLPAPVVLVFVNFLLLTIVVFGDRRFTLVMDHLVITTAFAYVLSFFMDWRKQSDPFVSADRARYTGS